MFSRSTQRFFQRRCQSTLRSFSTASSTESKATATTTATTTTSTTTTNNIVTPKPTTTTTTPPPPTTTATTTTTTSINYAPGSYVRSPPEVAWSFNRDYVKLFDSEEIRGWSSRLEQCGTSDFAFLVAAPQRHWFRRACGYFVLGGIISYFYTPTINNWYKLYEQLPIERQLQILKWIQLQSQRRINEFSSGFTNGKSVYQTLNPYEHINYEQSLIELGYGDLQGDERQQGIDMLKQEDQDYIGKLEPVFIKYKYFPAYHQFLTQKLHDLESLVESTRKVIVDDEEDV